MGFCGISHFPKKSQLNGIFLNVWEQNPKNYPMELENPGKIPIPKTGIPIWIFWENPRISVLGSEENPIPLPPLILCDKIRL